MFLDITTGLYTTQGHLPSTTLQGKMGFSDFVAKGRLSKALMWGALKFLKLFSECVGFRVCCRSFQPGLLVWPDRNSATNTH